MLRTALLTSALLTHTMLSIAATAPVPTTAALTTTAHHSLGAFAQKHPQQLSGRAFFALSISDQGQSQLLHLKLASPMNAWQLMGSSIHANPSAPWERYSLASLPLHVHTDTFDVVGLEADEVLVGVDVQIKTGTLFAISSWGALYRLIPHDTHTYKALLVVPSGVDTDEQIDAFKRHQRWLLTHFTGKDIPLDPATPIGFDFNPTVDRIRLVTADGHNFRLHPQTGMLVDSNAQMPGTQIDAPLHFSTTSAQQHSDYLDHPLILAAGYSYNTHNDKITTNFAIDAQGTLMHQGSLEGTTPSVSPNTGALWHLMDLGTGALADAHLDISDVGNHAFAFTKPVGSARYTLSYLDIVSGKRYPLYTTARPILGFTIEP